MDVGKQVLIIKDSHLFIKFYNYSLNPLVKKTVKTRNSQGRWNTVSRNKTWVSSLPVLIAETVCFLFLCFFFRVFNCLEIHMCQQTSAQNGRCVRRPHYPLFISLKQTMQNLFLVDYRFNINCSTVTSWGPYWDKWKTIKKVHECWVWSVTWLQVILILANLSIERINKNS